MAYLAAIIWVIWKSRKNIIFNNEVRVVEEIKVFILALEFE